jgi:hypothetical protein
MSSEQEAKIEKAMYEFLKWLLKAGIVFQETEANGAAIGKYLAENKLEWTFPNMAKAHNALVGSGHQFDLETPAVPAAPAKVEKPLPEVPPYMQGIKSKDDVLKCPKYSEWLYGKHGQLFKARVDEILRRDALTRINS